MQTNFSDAARALPHADEAERILRNCVHCGFCNATCPTYQELGNELDGPRGRIYLIKQFLEHDVVSAATQEHLDRCLTCRNCETTCPSGVEYHKLLDIGRPAIDARVRRPASERLLHEGLRQALPRPGLFRALFRTGQALKPLLPRRLASKMPRQIPAPGQRPQPRHTRRMLMLEGCVQPTLSPNTNAAATRVLDRLGISIEPVREAGCCGAVDFHAGTWSGQRDGLARARRNIDAWWPRLQHGAEAIIQTASGCGAFIKEYGYLLRDDPQYAEKARAVSAKALDLFEVLAQQDLESIRIQSEEKIAFHCPCTLQHAQKLGALAQQVLTRLGLNLTTVPDAHLCCGSAGTYSITQPELAKNLRDNKLDALESGHPDRIVTANIGCQSHLDGAGRTPVRHWIEVIDEALHA
ncbi:glycolate oxidase iron-sulfur subunit [Lampropedia cohaerens]|uniref:Glycolate oxidase iron-sulfur subunit n=1 Tax=Lampropedia cohaerens TaxID=1610491 RepID=A0A0U1PXA0_9BURK|nr:glycolate oxidase subunit GlcF [Lampropedia cohaerens]KKW67120.1 glycolate oxidase iron-sulfur subunit [Lampropedia cohaerens]